MIIYPDENSRYLLSILSSIKHNFNPVLDTCAIADLIDRVYKSKVDVNVDELIIFTRQLITYTDSEDDLIGPTIAWHYFLYCKIHNVISTKSVFNEYMKDLFNNIVYDNITTDYGLPDIVEYLSHFGNCKVINYTDLFFKLKIPSDSLLSKMDKTEIYNYSKTNLKLIIKFFEQYINSS